MHSIAEVASAAVTRRWDHLLVDDVALRARADKGTNTRRVRPGPHLTHVDGSGGLGPTITVRLGCRSAKLLGAHISARKFNVQVEQAVGSQCSACREGDRKRVLQLLVCRRRRRWTDDAELSMPDARKTQGV